MTESVYRQMFSFSRYCQFYKVVVPICSPIQQGMRVLISSHPHKHLDLSVFSMVAILVDVS